MDLNDPRRRLLGLNTANPSIRLASAPRQNVANLRVNPQQQLSVVQAPTYQNRIPKPSSASFSANQTPLPKFSSTPKPVAPETSGWGRFANIFKPISEGGFNPFADAGNFVKNAVVKPTVEFGGKALNTVAIPAVGIAGAIDAAVTGGEEGKQKISNLNKTLEGLRKNSFVSKDIASGKASVGEFARDFTKTGVEGATYALPAAKLAQGANLGTRLAINSGANAAITGGSNAALQALENGKVDLTEVATSAVAGGILGSIGARGGSGDKIVRNLAESVADETNPAAIKAALGVDDELASYLANESSKKSIESVIRQLTVDPNLSISGAAKQKLQEEGISAVRKKDNEYGAEYNPADASINLKDQSFATDANVYHELGHHIYKNKLTPEEQALFKGEGKASQSAKGRDGYDTSDVNSEDFSDYLQKALTGRLDEVPENLRSVIKKYAKIADEEAANIGLPETAVSTSGSNLYNKLTEEELKFLKNENIEIPQLDAPEPRLKDTNKISAEDVANVSPNTKTAIENADAKIAEEAQAVSRAQTGISDAAPDGSVKTTSPDDAGTTFTNQVDDVTGNAQNASESAVRPSAGISPQTADEIVPGADAETKKAVQEVLDNLGSAQKSYDVAAKTRTQEKASRITSGDAAFQAAGGGEAGVRAKLGALKGKYTESGFNPITASESTQNTILNDIESSSLRSFEKLNLQNAMRKIWGATEGKPTPGEINSIRKYFGEDGEQMAKAIEDAIEESPTGWRDRVVDIAGIPRAAMASFDLSMGLRQGGQVAVRNFPQWVNANKESIKYAKNADYFKSEMKRIADDDAYETIVDKLGVRLPSVQGRSDEIMASAHILEKIPVYGKGIEASDRAYSGGLSKLRFNIAKQWIDSLGGPDKALKDLSEKELRDIGEVINTSTGSGGKKGGFTEKNMQTLATTLFAPRLWASRLNAINPAYYARLSPVARRRAIENIASFMGAASVVVGLAGAAGADVEMDPRSSDFMKIKTGNTRFDVLGGLQQNIVFFTRLITGEKKNSSSGEIQTLGDGFAKPTRLDLAQDMLQNKLNPLLGYAARMLQSGEGDTGNPLDRKDKFGEDMNVATETAKLGVPLGVQGLADTYNDTGDPVKSVAMNIPNFFGIGTQTYGKTATKDQSKPEADLTTEEKVAKIKADKKARKEDNIATLSESDKSLYELGNADRASLSAKEKSKYDQIKKYITDRGTDIEVPDGANSEPAKTFYKKYNSMTEKDQKAWLSQSPDDNAKTIATELNKKRVAGLSELKPSNELSKAYAEYEKDIATHPEYTKIDRLNKVKAFQTASYKLNYSNDQRDIYAEGGSSDLKTLIDDGSISKEDLDNAIKMDDELFASGLTGKLKFSKKFRGTYGYGVPAGSGGGGRSGGRGGSGSKRAYLSAYVNNGKEGNATPVPTFSSKPRTKGISFKNVNSPKKNNSKKVSINL